MGPDAAVPSAGRQQAKQFVAGVVGVFNDPAGLLPTPLGVEVLRGWRWPKYFIHTNVIEFFINERFIELVTTQLITTRHIN